MKELVQELRSQMDETKDENHNRKKEIESKDILLQKKLNELADTTSVQMRAS